MWYVYFLELKNGDIYVGSTNDLQRRFASHQQGDVASTSTHLLHASISAKAHPTQRKICDFEL